MSKTMIEQWQELGNELRDLFWVSRDEGIFRDFFMVWIGVVIAALACWLG